MHHHKWVLCHGSESVNVLLCHRVHVISRYVTGHGRESVDVLVHCHKSVLSLGRENMYMNVPGCHNFKSACHGSQERN